MSDQMRTEQVPANLVPTDGLTNSLFSLVSMRRLGSRSGSIDFDFELIDEVGKPIGTFTVTVASNGSNSTDAMIADAYAKMVDVTRQWLYTFEKMRRAYAERLEG